MFEEKGVNFQNILSGYLSNKCGIEIYYHYKYLGATSIVLWLLCINYVKTFQSDEAFFYISAWNLD